MLPNLRIRAEQPADIPAIAQVTLLAFDQRNGEEVEMIERIRASHDFLPELSLVAEKEGRVVGHLLISRSHLLTGNGQPSAVEVLLLGPISVLPEFQRQGIGGALMRRGMRIARARPEPMIVLLGHPSYYPRFGFRPAREYGLLPDWNAAMIYPQWEDISSFRGMKLPQ